MDILSLDKLEELSSLKPQYVCIFGAGEIGKTWGYEFITCAGFKVDFFCDNHIAAGKEIRDGIFVKDIDSIKDAGDDIVVFITAGIKTAKTIFEQVKELTNGSIYVMTFDFYEDSLRQIETSSDGIKNKYRSVFYDELYLSKYYYWRTGKNLDLDNPVSFNEKLQWLKLYDRNPLYTKLSDKYEVKKYVSSKIGSDHVIPTLFLSEDADEIYEFDFPDQFVLKCTHDGGVIFCKDKSAFDIESALKELKERLRKNYYWPGREWCYKDILPRVICEPYIVDESGVELKDYKVFCFDGEPRLIQVDFDRFVKHKRNLYTTDWKLLDAEIEFPSDNGHVIEKPKVLGEMLEYASILSQGIPHVRTDFYICDEEIFLGEMTFYHGNGCEDYRPESLGIELGSYIDLNKAWVNRDEQ